MSHVGGILLGLFASACVSATEQDPDNVLRQILASAKIAGGCTILLQMFEFQESTVMPGGDEFLARFMGMEAARLGITTPQYVQMCADAAKVVEFYSPEPKQAPGKP